MLLAANLLFLALCSASPSFRAGARMQAKTRLPTVRNAFAPLRNLKVKAADATTAEKPAEVAAEVPAPTEPAKEEWKGLESLYGGLYDNQVFTEYGWDPWKLGKKASKEQLLMYREAELVHGRVAMLAAAGILTAERWHPLFNSPDGTAIEQASYVLKNHPSFFFALGLFSSAVELLRAQKVFQNGGKKGSFIFRPYSADAMTLKEGVLPGDLGWDPLKIKPEEVEGVGGLRERQEQEINNGRLAMLATMGLLMQEAATGVPQG
eukprot:CAMPEP_0167756654 /NCGR_PEP_ID=MMETSP0110_2-20121227/9504_1 /TAXON_ID=629695 /ORGANISM="Gymnochlora sp., Strain CCMP2014" /LENGTH=263 /DNA_ID=CAMNT_0007642785 /DNA_START=208 /DNA_END=999 /DNA_ORIENTATION=+